MIFYLNFAGVVELADARDSKSRLRKKVRVQLPPPAPCLYKAHLFIDFHHHQPKFWYNITLWRILSSMLSKKKQ